MPPNQVALCVSFLSYGIVWIGVRYHLVKSQYLFVQYTGITLWLSPFLLNWYSHKYFWSKTDILKYSFSKTAQLEAVKNGSAFHPLLLTIIFFFWFLGSSDWSEFVALWIWYKNPSQNCCNKNINFKWVFEKKITQAFMGKFWI